MVSERWLTVPSSDSYLLQCLYFFGNIIDLGRELLNVECEFSRKWKNPADLHFGDCRCFVFLGTQTILVIVFYELYNFPSFYRVLLSAEIQSEDHFHSDFVPFPLPTQSAVWGFSSPVFMRSCGHMGPSSKLIRNLAPDRIHPCIKLSLLFHLLPPPMSESSEIVTHQGHLLITL